MSWATQSFNLKEQEDKFNPTRTVNACIAILDACGEGVGRGRSYAGEIGCRTAHSCAADASDAREDRDCGEREGRDRLGNKEHRAKESDLRMVAATAHHSTQRFK
jgi:hypothetical protein